MNFNDFFYDRLVILTRSFLATTQVGPYKIFNIIVLEYDYDNHTLSSFNDECRIPVERCRVHKIVSYLMSSDLN